jgi:thymidylate synthase
MTNTRNKFNNATEAFDYLLDKIRLDGVDFSGTKALFNVGFYMEDPSQKIITNKERKFSEKYAESEWLWYLSGDRSVERLGAIHGKIPPIWLRMADEDGNVNSNYGWQWKRNNQLYKVIAMLENNPNTRQATISIYDGKEIDSYSKDTPCTYAVQFTILDNKLCMSVLMRSNDLWYGFCNDQYQFATLQQWVAENLSIETGWYYHYAHNMHLYNDKL